MVKSRFLFKACAIFLLFGVGMPVCTYAKKKGLLHRIIEDMAERQAAAQQRAKEEREKFEKEVFEAKVALAKLKDPAKNPGYEYRVHDGVMFGGSVERVFNKDNVKLLEERIKEIEAKKKRVEKEEKEERKRRGETESKIAESLGNAIADSYRADSMREENILRENMKLKSSERKWEKILDFFKDPKKVAILSAAIAGTVVGCIGGYYLCKHGSRILAKEIEKRLGKPTIVSETSRTTWWQRFRGKVPKVEKLTMDDFVATPEFREKLERIITYFKNANANGDTLPHLLLYGLPGTGKTYWAMKILAHMSNSHYASISGNAVSELPPAEGINELRKIFGWAKHANKRVIFVFDEAEDFLGRRQNVSVDRRKTITEFLSLIPKAYHELFSIVLITNRLNDLDPAVVSRTAKRIKFETPKKEQFEEMIPYYANRVAQAKGFEIQDGIERIYPQLARDAEKIKFVGRDIDKIFNVWVVEAVRNSEENVITPAIIRKAFADQIEDRKEELGYDFDTLTSNQSSAQIGTTAIPSGISAG